MRREIDAAAAALAARQHGLFARGQLDLTGSAGRMLAKRRLDAGIWLPAGRLVYRLPGSPPSWRQRLMARCLAWGAIASHRSAGALAGLPPLREGPLDVTAPPGRGRTRHGAAIHRQRVPLHDRTTIGGIPTTTIERTLLDLASVLGERDLEIALDDALRRGWVAMRRIHDRVAWERRRGNEALRRIIERRVHRIAPQSPLETRMLRALLDAGLPHPRMQHPVRAREGLLAILDFAYPEHGVAIETDGYAYHSGRVQWERDLKRRNALTLAGWRVIHVTSAELTQSPHPVVDAIRNALLAAGART